MTDQLGCKGLQITAMYLINPTGMINHHVVQQIINSELEKKSILYKLLMMHRFLKTSKLIIYEILFH